jgi:hypothetical protein
MNKFIRALIVAALAAGGIFYATPAFAMVGQAGYITFWDGCTGGSSTNHTVGYCGAAWPIPGSRTRNVCYSVPTGSNDRWSAFSNNSGHNVDVYTAGECGGSRATLYNGTETGQLTAAFNNTISSYAVR